VTGAHNIPTRRRNLALPGAMVLGGLVRVYAAGFSGGIAADGVVYVRMARELLQSGFSRGFHPMIPPGYPMALAAVGALGGDLELAGQIVSVAAGILAIAVVYLIAREVAGTKTALAAAWLYACAPMACRFAAKVQTESLYALVLSLGILAALRLLRDRRVYRWFVLGALAGVAYMIRPEGMGLLLVTAIWLIPIGCSRGLPQAFKTAGGVMLALAAFAVAGIWQVLYFHELTGRWTPSAKLEYFYRMDTAGDSQEFFYSLTADKTMTRQEAEALTARQYEPVDMGSEALSHPGRFLGHWAANMAKFAVLWPEGFGYALVPLFFAGIFLRRGLKRDRLKELFAGSVVVFFTAAISLTFAERRLLVPLVPVMCTWAGAGVIELSALPARRKRTGKRHRVPVPVFIVSAAVVLTLPTTLLRPLRRDLRWATSPERDVGLWVKRRFGTGMNVMAIKPKVPFYAQGNHIPLPLAPYADMIEFSRLRGVDVMVLGEHEAAKRRAGLIDRLKPQDFSLVARIDEGRETYLVYRFTGDTFGNDQSEDTVSPSLDRPGGD